MCVSNINVFSPLITWGEGDSHFSLAHIAFFKWLGEGNPPTTNYNKLGSVFRVFFSADGDPNLTNQPTNQPTNQLLDSPRRFGLVVFSGEVAMSSGLPSSLGRTSKAGESSTALAALAECRRCGVEIPVAA